jgi:hypothetical protein
MQSSNLRCGSASSQTLTISLELHLHRLGQGLEHQPQRQQVRPQLLRLLLLQ